MKILFFFVLLLMWTKPALGQIEHLELIIDNLIQPSDIANAGDESGRLFILEKEGVVQVYTGTGESGEFLDISEQVSIQHSEMGLLGIAFHPDFSTNNLFYLFYSTEIGGNHFSRLSRFLASDDLQIGDPSSEIILLEIEQPYDNHNGGALLFGDDGYLYIATGDGGGYGDPEDNAQSLGNLYGKILRIDVNNGEPYGIPADNPFVGNENALNEIYAYGLRNPWKLSKDKDTGEIYIADVGQEHREEINLLEPYANFGWNIMEGALCFPPGTECEPTGVLPIYEYSIYEQEHCSIIGGYVYRGDLIPELQGQYIYGDFCSGTIWSLKYNGEQVESPVLLSTDFQISTFGEDEDGELYVADYNGSIYKFTKQITSITKERTDFHVNIFPNPSSKKVNINTSSGNIDSIHIFNMKGREIRSYTSGKNNITINCEDIESGLYLLQVIGSSGSSTVQKLMIEN